MTFKEAVNSLYIDYVVVVPGNTQDMPEPLLAGGLDIMKELSEYSYTKRLVRSIRIEEDTAVITLEEE